jgi:hypothetical protein
LVFTYDFAYKKYHISINDKRLAHVFDIAIGNVDKILNKAQKGPHSLRLLNAFYIDIELKLHEIIINFAKDKHFMTQFQIVHSVKASFHQVMTYG